MVNPTTPAQIFHLLRRQMVRPFRKPLIVAGPKTLLRLPAAVSPLTHLAPGTKFEPVLDDESASKKEAIRRLVFVSGKHYYTLRQHRQEKSLSDVAIVRLEELCPFPALALQKLSQSYQNAREYVWAQEEPRNGGAWSYVEPRFRCLWIHGGR